LAGRSNKTARRFCNQGTGGGRFVTSIDQKKLPEANGFFQLKLYSLDGTGSGNILCREIEEPVAGENFIPTGKPDVPANYTILGRRRYMTTALSL
jgi:hypothetical protein